jgi:hypothetical protein
LIFHFRLFSHCLRLILIDNARVTLLFRTVFLALLLTSCPAFGQSLGLLLTAHGPFDPGAYKPLNGRERWQRWVSEDGASPALHVESLATADFLQIINAPSAWGRNTGGYLRRAGSSYASDGIENSVRESMAWAEGTEPRYLICGCTGFFHRTGHALKMTLLTYNRKGRETLDVPQLAGAYGSSMIEAMWYPPHYSPLVQGVQSGHIEVGILGAEHLAQEFSPELKRIFHLRFGVSP